MLMVGTQKSVCFHNAKAGRELIWRDGYIRCGEAHRNWYVEMLKVDRQGIGT